MSWPTYERYTETTGSDPVPDHWKVSKLRHLMKVNPSVPESLRSDVNKTVTFLPMEAIGEDGTLDTTRERSVGELVTGYSYFADGDVIVAKVTPCFENGKAAVIEALPTRDGFGTSEVTTLRPGNGLDQQFLGYLVRSDRFRQSSIAAMTGAGGLKRVPDEHVRSFQIGLPPTAEQSSIVSFLDHETAKIDALIAKQEQLIATLREDRAATITQAVTKGLDPTVEMRDSGASWIGEVPAHWSVAKVKHGFSVTLGKMYQGEMQSSDDVQLPHLKAGSVTATGLNLDEPMLCWFSQSEIRSLTLRKGDILVVEGGAIGRCVVLDRDLNGWGFQKSLNRVRALRDDSPVFLAYLIEAATLCGHVSILCGKATIPHFTAEKVGALKWPHPSVEEQLAIAGHLDDRCGTIDGLIGKSTEMIEALREYRSALITDAVTGKIDVRGVA
ncbi:MAG: hypothetical protein DI630_09405 [Gordonia sp. (in: high G+C Gram-positive bacteria)]|nr:MAG: hypothetical protein DI630_09405 [Gordonia sp. (in: high G+C Gram-positive bacteria)]